MALQIGAQWHLQGEVRNAVLNADVFWQCPDSPSHSDGQNYGGLVHKLFYLQFETEGHSSSSQCSNVCENSFHVKHAKWKNSHRCSGSISHCLSLHVSQCLFYIIPLKFTETCRRGDSIIWASPQLLVVFSWTCVHRRNECSSVLLKTGQIHTEDKSSFLKKPSVKEMVGAVWVS